MARKVRKMERVYLQAEQKDRESTPSMIINLPTILALSRLNYLLALSLH